MKSNRMRNIHSYKIILILNHICMSIWQVQGHQSTLWSSTGKQYVPVRKSKKIFKGMPSTFGIADDILIVGYDTDGRGHDRTSRPVMQICT